MREGRGEEYRREDQTVPPCYNKTVTLTTKESWNSRFSCVVLSQPIAKESPLEGALILPTVACERVISHARPFLQRFSSQVSKNSHEDLFGLKFCNHMHNRLQFHCHPYGNGNGNISSLFMHICIGMDCGYKLYCLLWFSTNLLPIDHSRVHIGEKHLQCSWFCWTWFSCLTGIGLLVDWLVYWYWLVGWLVLVCLLVECLVLVGWLTGWFLRAVSLSEAVDQKLPHSFSFSLSKSLL